MAGEMKIKDVFGREWERIGFITFPLPESLVFCPLAG